LGCSLKFEWAHSYFLQHIIKKSIILNRAIEKHYNNGSNCIHPKKSMRNSCFNFL
jgi:hypothetical protein